MQWLNLAQSKQPELRNTLYKHALAVASNIAIASSIAIAINICNNIIIVRYSYSYIITL